MFTPKRAAVVEVVAPVGQVVAPAERAVVPAALAEQVLVVPAPAELALALVRALEVLARVVQLAARVLVQLVPAQLVQVVALALEVLVQVVPLALLVRPAERVPLALLVLVQARVVVQPPAALVPAPRGPVPAQLRAVAAVLGAEAVERVALKSLTRSCAVPRRYMSRLPRIYLSKYGLSAASATTSANRVASLSKPW